jgi:threonine 3-dehydrogenase
MRAVIKPKPGPGLEYREDWPVPQVGPGQALIEIAAASLCGTDREIVEYTAAAQDFALKMPVVIGHEGSGVVREVGEGVTSVAPGDRVAMESHVWCGRCLACRTGFAHACPRTRIVGMHIDGLFAEYAVVPAEVCVRIPDPVSLETAALLESAGVGVHAVQRAEHAVVGGAVLVNGCGPVGLVVGELARIMGATQVVAVDPNPFRRSQAESRGFTAVDPVSVDVASMCRDLAGARGGVDAAFEASGARNVLGTVLSALRVGGTAVTIGHPSEPTPLDVAASVNKRQITLRGVYGRRLWETWESLVALLGSERLRLDWLVTHRLELHEAERAVELLTGDSAKVLLN